MMKVAVVGGGVTGLAAAHELARSGGARVTLYEKQDHLGGYARTVDVDDGSTGSVHLDLSLMVFNRVTSPNMVKWFEGLGVETERSDMSFSVSTLLELDNDSNAGGFEWGSRNGISGLLAQKRNWLSPSFWRMILEIFKFKNHAIKYLEHHERNPDLDRSETLGQFISSHGYSKVFQDAYLIPMCASIWSCPSQVVFGFPAFFALSYCRDNHLLELFGRPDWHTVKGCSESYVNKVRGELESMGCQIKISCEVKSVSSLEGDQEDPQDPEDQEYFEELGDDYFSGEEEPDYDFDADDFED